MAKQPVPSPARTKLAERIAARDATRQAIAMLEGIDAWQAIGAAETEAETAREALAQAEELAREHRILKLTGQPHGPAPDVAGARSALHAAEAAVAEARETSQDIRTRLDEARADIERRESYAAAAAAAVLVDESGPLVARLHTELTELQLAFVQKSRALLLLTDRLPPPGTEPNREALSAARLSNIHATAWPLWESHAGKALEGRLTAALDALKQDAAAPVPGAELPR
jgi:bacterioferritin (cytochrome b1)